ncbi:CcoQ/FixQ family Cbb3-type cytochrome c oxidase assembly chaperone [Marinoscillum sp. MHG1-6]|uniref:CcoQ/FixQ family Cbb3-type cytochrome c oxidase assembly chaperone n=1 Tax=Marinoscillum sp. MHG1-6 TaxID=2959627 RepID=UPI0021588949|nr:CcoQ/FixQ family Cbb3-type cytochrome c oxidase assembly chaperone [Marinoscillum sp. MHG1-6]
MLKFIKHHMETITGIEIYPLISFIIFFAFFIGLTIYVIRVSKSHINYVSRLPLDSKTDNYE